MSDSCCFWGRYCANFSALSCSPYKRIILNAFVITSMKVLSNDFQDVLLNLFLYIFPKQKLQVLGSGILPVSMCCECCEANSSRSCMQVLHAACMHSAFLKKTANSHLSHEKFLQNFHATGKIFTLRFHFSPMDRFLSFDF